MSNGILREKPRQVLAERLALSELIGEPAQEVYPCRRHHGDGQMQGRTFQGLSGMPVASRDVQKVTVFEHALPSQCRWCALVAARTHTHRTLRRCSVHAPLLSAGNLQDEHVVGIPV